MKTMLSIPRTISRVVSVASAIHASGLVRRSIPVVCKRDGVRKRGGDPNAARHILTSPRASPFPTRCATYRHSFVIRLEEADLIDRGRRS